MTWAGHPSFFSVAGKFWEDMREARWAGSHHNQPPGEGHHGYSCRHAAGPAGGVQQLPYLAIAHSQNQYKRRRKAALISKPRGPWPHPGRRGGPGARMRRRPPGSGPSGATGSRGRNGQRSRPVPGRGGSQNFCFVQGGPASPRGGPSHARAGPGADATARPAVPRKAGEQNTNFVMPCCGPARAAVGGLSRPRRCGSGSARQLLRCSSWGGTTTPPLGCDM